MLAQSAIRSYQQSSVNVTDPLKLIVIAYNHAIAGCRQRNLEMTGRAIKELINGLRMDVKPIAARLLAIYQYCGELARNKQFDEAANILQELRDAWTAAAANNQRSPINDH
jgi:flagellin-specific chaperone FliS